jgi:hypothetical protein
MAPVKHLNAPIVMAWLTHTSVATLVMVMEFVCLRLESALVHSLISGTRVRVLPAQTIAVATVSVILLLVPVYAIRLQSSTVG